jgi:protein-S-isoprenylcysteine O-methyltransferase Ste14
MRILTAAAASSVFFLIAPATVAGAIPWWLTRWRVADPLPYGRLVQMGGILLIVVAVSVLVHAFVRFVFEGRGTPSPVAPAAHLVIGGPYRYVRNPMYLAVLSAVIGQAIVLAQRSLLVYAGALAAAFVSFVRLYEEPTLESQFGEAYEAYRRAVPGWWPRLRPWRP